MYVCVDTTFTVWDCGECQMGDGTARSVRCVDHVEHKNQQAIIQTHQMLSGNTRYVMIILSVAEGYNNNVNK